MALDAIKGQKTLAVFASDYGVHKKLVQPDETELNTVVSPLSRLNRTLVVDKKLTQFARCKLKWASNGIHISYC